MKKTVLSLLILIISITIISSVFGSYIKKLENFASYSSASCNCIPGYTYNATESVNKRCVRKNFPAVSEECTCPEKFVYDGPAAAASRCHQQ